MPEQKKPELSVKGKQYLKGKRPQTAILRRNFKGIIADISEGKSLQDCLRYLGLDWKTFFRHLEACPEARQEYSRARVCRVERYVDELVPMSDAVIGQEMNVVTATRNAVDVRKWVASKLMPKEYGDQGTGVTINNQTNVLVMSEEKLRSLQETRRKMLEQTHNNAPGV